jgi:hypothetical protein
LTTLANSASTLLPRGVNESPPVLLDEGVDNLAVGRQTAECRLFVLPHEAAVAVNVGAEYGGELALHDLTPRRESSCWLLAVVNSHGGSPIWDVGCH